MKEKCEVKYCSERKCWCLYDTSGKQVDDSCYSTKEAAINAGRCFCEETGDELCVYNKKGELTSRRKVKNMVGE